VAQESLSKQIKSEPKIHSLFAEMYVAAALADEDWAIYFPRRDVGFDMIAVKGTRAGVVIRPIQVKGLYPSSDKLNKKIYGFRGKLSQLHDDMALVLVYFDVVRDTPSPNLVAWMPRSEIKPGRKLHRCEPARFQQGKAMPRREFASFFGSEGLRKMELATWSVPR